MLEPAPRILAFATQGHGGNEEARILELLQSLHPELFPYDRSLKLRMFWRLLRAILRTRPNFVVMEGTGLAGGAALIAARLCFGRRYVVSSGDAVGPWIGGRHRFLGPPFALYERLLCRLAAGFIGWTPYLVGRALTFGAPRAMTAAGWAPFTRTAVERAAERIRIRAALGIAPDRLVVGIAGSLAWSRRYGYCYGCELVEAARLVHRPDVTFLVVGDGNGRAHLDARAASLPAGRVVFTGHVSQADLPGYYSAMEIGSLPQSVDRVGSFRYTTKLSEYLAFGLPVITGRIPLAYDLDDGWLWRLPGNPWEPRYAAALATLLDGLTVDELAARKAAVPSDPPEFRKADQVVRVGAFVRELFDRAI